MTSITEAIGILSEHIKDPKVGLPDEIFYFLTKITPMVNVDLLIQDKAGRTLLAWRDDHMAGTGWHIPGGIIRVKETLMQRLHKVAELEIGEKVEFQSVPIAVNEIIVPRDVRGHFVSILYRGRVPEGFEPTNKNKAKNEVGYLQWHGKCPENFIAVQNIYRKFF